MADALKVLGRDHDKVRRLLTKLENGPSAISGATDRQLRARKRLTDQLIIGESGHEAAEEQYFWPAVRDRLPDGDRLADHAAEQEQQAKEVLARLDRLDPWDDDFDRLLVSFIAAAREHIAFEEGIVWPGVRETLTRKERGELGRQLAKARELAPTRPHPHVPANPDVLKATGPAVGTADRLRDAATGRGE